MTDPKERALRKLVQVAEALTKGVDRDKVAASAARARGSAYWGGGLTNARIRDLMDATAKARKALGE